MQWEGRLDKLKVAAYELRYERGRGTNLDLPGGVCTFEGHPLTEEEKDLWRYARVAGSTAGRCSKLEEDIANIIRKIEEGEPLTDEEQAWLAVYQEECDRPRKKDKKKKSKGKRAAGQSSKPSVKQQHKQGSRKSLRLQESAAKGKLKS
jgi:hypothetical protein